jgi:glutaredoxin
MKTLNVCLKASQLGLFCFIASISLLATATQPLDGLPFELRQVVSRFPVVLYTSDNCTPCNSARNLLRTRGVPLTEYTITTPEDAQALRALGANTALPLITVGRQRITGFDERELQQFLDLAGYPTLSTLPKNFRQAAATPLAEPPRATDKAANLPRAETAPEAAKPPLPETSTANPAGIRF